MKTRTKQYVLLTALSLGVWIAGGTWFYDSICCSTNTGSFAQESAMQFAYSVGIKDGDRSVLAMSSTRHPKGGERYVSSSFAQNSMMDIVHYMEKYPLKKLVVEGLYLPDEASKDLLGEKRAKEIVQYLGKKGVALERMTISTRQKKDILVINDTLLAAVQLNFMGTVKSKIEDPMNHKEIVLNDSWFFKYKEGTLAVENSVILRDAVEEIVTYLKTNPTRKIEIKGIAEEKEVLENPEIGLLRASSIKSLLVSKGVNSYQINLSEELVVNGSTMETSYYGKIVYDCIRFSFLQMQPNESKIQQQNLELIERRLNSQVKRLTGFGKDSYRLKLTVELNNYFDDLVKLTRANSNMIIYCTGYTDNINSDEVNYNIGQHRANNMKKYLINLGVQAEQIVANSGGETNPVSSNKTEEGKRLNRRVEIRVSANGIPKELKKCRVISLLSSPQVKSTNDSLNS